MHVGQEAVCIDEMFCSTNAEANGEAGFFRCMYAFDSLPERIRMMTKTIMQLRNIMIKTYYYTLASCFLQCESVIEGQVKSRCCHPACTFATGILNNIYKIFYSHHRFAATEMKLQYTLFLQ